MNQESKVGGPVAIGPERLFAIIGEKEVALIVSKELLARKDEEIKRLKEQMSTCAEK